MMRWCFLAIAGLAAALAACQTAPAAEQTIVVPAGGTQAAATAAPTNTPVESAVNVITWQRMGGIAGTCQQLAIRSDGAFILSDPCRKTPAQSGTLSAADREDISRWLATYQPFVWVSSTPVGSADIFTLRLNFQGTGSQPASVPMQQQMAEELARLASRLRTPPVASATPPASGHGIVGQAVLGPMCPVVSDANACPDRPYEATVDVLAPDGSLVKEFTTAVDGTFRVNLPPGDYVLQGVEAKAFPRPPRLSVTVRTGAYTQVTLSFDSGIR